MRQQTKLPHPEARTRQVRHLLQVCSILPKHVFWTLPTHADSTFFRSLEMPPELRNRIYAFAPSSNETTTRNLADVNFPLLIQVNQ